MQRKTIQLNYLFTNDLNQFSPLQIELINTTISFAKNAYAPYSDFNVSAGLLLETGEIIKGTNVENASYPVGICAERTLLSHTISNYPETIITDLAVFVDKDLNRPVPPCGLCRQTLIEAEKRQKHPIRLILIGYQKEYLLFEDCASLLPLSFDGDYLNA